jgi:hypothetical protein
MNPASWPRAQGSLPATWILSLGAFTLRIRGWLRTNTGEQITAINSIQVWP